MEKVEDALVLRALDLLKEIPDNQRLLIALAGSPGSGKSTVSKHVVHKINKASPNEIAIVITQDGFHYRRSELREFPDREEAFKRRGAPFTFNSMSFLLLVQKIRKPINGSNILAPDFDHKTKDPKEDKIILRPSHRIVFIEGNYLLLNDDNWREIASLVDERWKIHIEQKLAEKRVIKRHIEAGISQNVEEAKQRYYENDLINSNYIKENSRAPDLIFESLDGL